MKHMVLVKSFGEPEMAREVVYDGGSFTDERCKVGPKEKVVLDIWVGVQIYEKEKKERRMRQEENFKKRKTTESFRRLLKAF